MISNVVFDVDGVLNTGHFVYGSEGKMFKIFGPHDKDGIKILRKYSLNIKFITADKIGWSISYARLVKDWGVDTKDFELVTEEDRLGWFERNFDLSQTVYMADGYHDVPILEKVLIGIAPSNARIEAKNASKFVTDSSSGQGAVLDAALYIEKIINGLEKI